MTRLIIILVIIGFTIGWCSSAPDDQAKDYRIKALEYCRMQWKDSGYKWRVVGRDTQPPRVPSYRCQVNVNGRWVPEENVKVGN